MKKYCTTHHFSFNGVECPFCLNDRIERFSHVNNVKNSINSKDSFNEKLSALLEKYSKKDED